MKHSAFNPKDGTGEEMLPHPPKAAGRQAGACGRRKKETYRVPHSLFFGSTPCRQKKEFANFLNSICTNNGNFTVKGGCRA